MQHAPLNRGTVKPLFSDWKLGTGSILAFWLAYGLLVIGRALLSDDPVSVIAQRLPMVGTGIVLTGCIYLVMQAVDDDTSVKLRATIAGLASILAAIAQAFLIIAMAPTRSGEGEEWRFESNEGAVITQRGNEIIVEGDVGDGPMVFTLPRIDELNETIQLRAAADAAVVWLFFFAAWSAVYLAAVSATQVAETRRRLAAARAEAQAAQVRALRYQVNPHFLFNTLNSLSSLVMTGRQEQAESMLIALSNFFRNSLSLDPNESVTLAREIDLQRLYLQIEQQRFPKRLEVEIDVPDALADMAVPALILQPLVENAIKYGVSRAKDAVHLSIGATTLDDGRARISVFNTLPKAADDRRPMHAGTGTGLTNVAARLAAHFGSRGDCRFGPVEGGYRVDLIMPREEISS